MKLGKCNPLNIHIIKIKKNNNNNNNIKNKNKINSTNNSKVLINSSS